MKDTENLSLIIFLSIAPIIFLVMGLINFFNSSLEQAYGFLGVFFVSLIIAIIIYCIEINKQKKMLKLKTDNKFLLVPIVSVTQDDESLLLDINAQYKHNNIDISFYGTYSCKDGLGEEINKKMNELNIYDIKIWVDLEDYKFFEYDIDDFLKRLNITDSGKVEIVGWNSKEIS